MNKIFEDFFKRQIPEADVREKVQNGLARALKRENDKTTTENGMNAYKSTNSALLDLYGKIGAMRNTLEFEVISKFEAAFVEDPLLALKLTFYARDIRQGLGERKVPKEIWTHLAKVYPDIMRENLKHIPEFGRWDDLYLFVDTPVEKDMWKVVKDQLAQDVTDMQNGKPISLIAKWLKSVNTSSKVSVELGRKTAKALGFTDRQYQKLLAKLRSYINVLEAKMSAQEWKEIEYSSVPSRAMKNYRKAFYEHDKEGFVRYIEDVQKGKKKINSGTLYPYDIVEQYMTDYGWRYGRHPYDPVIEEQWKALPNFVDTDDNVLIMADTSGSMDGRPLATAIGLAIYFAERNKGAFANTFMTFSESPTFVELKGRTLVDKVYTASRANWGNNTDIEKAFMLILSVAQKNHVSPEDMPKSLIIVSDMQFDRQKCSYEWDFYSDMKARFARCGYTIPNIVFWNVRDTKDTFHVKSNYEGVQLASGSSTSVFKAILNNMDLTPYQAMVNVLNSERYNCIKLPYNNLPPVGRRFA